jgi:hypothetical protein
MTDLEKLREDSESASSTLQKHGERGSAAIRDTTSSPTADLSGSVAGRDHKALDRMRAALNASMSALAPEGSPQDDTIPSSRDIEQPAAPSTTADLPNLPSAPSYPEAGNSLPKQGFYAIESRGPFGQSSSTEEKASFQLPRYSSTISTHGKIVSHSNNKEKHLQDSPGILLIGFSEKSEKNKKTSPNPSISLRNTGTPPTPPAPDDSETGPVPGLHKIPSTPIHPSPPKERKIGQDTSLRKQITGSTQFSQMLEGPRREQENRENKEIEFARRSAIAAEAALRAERNRTLEARKEAAFFREEAARARDEAMLYRKGMRLGLMAAAVSVLIAAAPYLLK